jgi:hypothetical protein
VHDGAQPVMDAIDFIDAHMLPFFAQDASTGTPPPQHTIITPPFNIPIPIKPYIIVLCLLFLYPFATTFI